MPTTLPIVAKSWRLRTSALPDPEISIFPDRTFLGVVRRDFREPGLQLCEWLSEHFHNG